MFAEDLESALYGTGLPPLRVAALLGERNAAPTAVVVLESAQRAWLDTVTEVVRPILGTAELVVLDAPPGTIERASSGKPKRRRMWSSYLEGRLPGTVVTPARRGAEVA